jgi:hypothetical protein
MNTKFIYETNKVVNKFLFEASIHGPNDAIAYIKNNADKYVGFFKIDNDTEKELINNFKNITSKFIYRALRVNSEKDIDKNKLGIYWTFDKYKAKAYWGDGDLFVLIKAKVTNNDIDWLGTIEQYLKPQYSGEDEVRLKENARPRIISIDISPIK